MNNNSLMEASVTEDDWTLDDAISQYGIERWGDGYFSISKDGTVLVSPDPSKPESVDLKALVDRLVDRGLELADSDSLQRDSA